MCPIAVVGDTDEGGKHPGKYPQCFAFSGRGTAAGELCVRYARGVLTRYEVVPVKGENIREGIPGVLRFWIDEPEEESCGFVRVGGCGGRTDCVSGFIVSF